MTEGEYRDGEKTGIWTAWDERGQKVFEEGYLNGKRHGAVKNFRSAIW